MPATLQRPCQTAKVAEISHSSNTGLAMLRIHIRTVGKIHQALGRRFARERTGDCPIPDAAAMLAARAHKLYPARLTGGMTMRKTAILAAAAFGVLSVAAP